jgi:hypothetical protein
MSASGDPVEERRDPARIGAERLRLANGCDVGAEVMVEPVPFRSNTVTLPVVEFDREDIFGVRRAWALLPEREWDSFLARWTEIGERCDYDIESIRAGALAEAAGARGIDDAVAQAWSTISAAMTAYLAWRAE